MIVSEIKVDGVVEQAQAKMYCLEQSLPTKESSGSLFYLNYASFFASYVNSKVVFDGVDAHDGQVFTAAEIALYTRLFKERLVSVVGHSF